MSDLISRQAAIDALDKEYRYGADIDRCGLAVALDEIEALPAADVVPVRHGKWKKIGVWGRVYRCNQCGNFLDFDGVNAGRGDANFCPNCGARMDGGEKDDVD